MVNTWNISGTCIQKIHHITTNCTADQERKANHTSKKLAFCISLACEHSLVISVSAQVFPPSRGKYEALSYVSWLGICKKSSTQNTVNLY